MGLVETPVPQREQLDHIALLSVFAGGDGTDGLDTSLYRDTRAATGSTGRRRHVLTTGASAPP
ncbi:hypothetical protein GCM10009525_13480 [Streptosporangium amethystogenes subsp. fukuiense]